MRGRRVRDQRQINLPSCTVHSCSFVQLPEPTKHQYSFGKVIHILRRHGETRDSLYPVLNQGKWHIPLTRNSTVAWCAPRLSFLFVSVGFSLKTLAVVPKNYGTPLEKYSSDSRKHCSICVLFVAWLLHFVQAPLTKSNVRHWRTRLLYHRVKFEPCKELRFDSRGFVAYTSKKKIWKGWKEPGTTGTKSKRRGIVKRGGKRQWWKPLPPTSLPKACL